NVIRRSATGTHSRGLVIPQRPVSPRFWIDQQTKSCHADLLYELPPPQHLPYAHQQPDLISRVRSWSERCPQCWRDFAQETESVKAPGYSQPKQDCGGDSGSLSIVPSGV